MSFGFLPVVAALSSDELLVLVLTAFAAAWFLSFELKRLRMLLLRRTIRREMMMNRKNTNTEVLTNAYMRNMLAYKIYFNVLVPLMVYERFIFLCITISIVFVIAATRVCMCGKIGII